VPLPADRSGVTTNLSDLIRAAGLCDFAICRIENRVRLEVFVPSADEFRPLRSRGSTEFEGMRNEFRSENEKLAPPLSSVVKLTPTHAQDSPRGFLPAASNRFSDVRRDAGSLPKSCSWRTRRVKVFASKMVLYHVDLRQVDELE
jgi:hypothetical protein